MEPTPTQLKAMQDADAARLVLENPLVSGALDKVERVIVDAWAGLGVDNQAQAYQLKHMLHAAKQFRAIFEIAIAGGEVAKHELFSLENLQARNDAFKRKIYG